MRSQHTQEGAYHAFTTSAFKPSQVRDVCLLPLENVSGQVRNHVLLQQLKPKEQVFVVIQTQPHTFAECPPRVRSEASRRVSDDSSL